jgi:CHAT domain-containing protein
MERLDYRDFEIEIGPGQGTHYPVAVLYSPSGQARTIMQLPSPISSRESRLATLEDVLLNGTPDQAAQAAQTFGRQLFDALFCDEVRRIYDLSRQAAAAQDQGLRIKLRLNAPELTALPWELMYDRRVGEFIALSRQTPILRYVELPLPDPQLAVAAPLRILGMVASPADLPPLEVDQEKGRLEEALRQLQDSRRLQLNWLEGQTWRDLQSALQSGPWHIFHFIGHAAPDLPGEGGALLLADEYGDSFPLSAVQLGRLLADQSTLRLALLNACDGAQARQASHFATIASLLVQRGMPAVVAMQFAISDSAAIEFTSSFYGALAAGLPIDAATSEARKAISLAQPDVPEWATPVLFTRAPDGVIWTMDEEAKAMDNQQKVNWWQDLPQTMGDFNAGDVGGDVIIASVGAGARNVAIGKNITQAVYETLGQPAQDDRQVIEAELSQTRTALARLAGQMGEGAATMAEGIFGRMEGELLKSGPDETPDADVITQMGDLLLNSVPHVAEILASLFAAPAVGRVVGKAGAAAVSWVRERFS